jgi:hypothetical protein
MSKLESIKERLEKGHYIVVHESAHGTPYHDNEPEEDVTYLLQLVERYETALKTITETKTHMQALYFANEALKE